MSSCLWLHGLYHTRPSCPSPSPRASSNWCPLSRWCHQTISSSVVLFSSCLQSFPPSVSFLMSQLFASISGLISFRLTALISLQSKGLSGLLQYHCSKVPVLLCSAFFMVQVSHLDMTTGKNIALTLQIFLGKSLHLLFNMLSSLS